MRIVHWWAQCAGHVPETTFLSGSRVWQKFCMWFLRGPAARNPQITLMVTFWRISLCWYYMSVPETTCIAWQEFLCGSSEVLLQETWWLFDEFVMLILYEDWCPWDSLPAGWLARLDLSGVRMTTFACDELDCLSTWVRMIQHLRLITVARPFIYFFWPHHHR